jgi:hypothetical protein
VATLEGGVAGRRIAVPSRLLIGRARSCGLILDSALASAEHAALAWLGDTWEIRDLGSRNGTFADGRRLGPGEAARVGVGSVLGFGDPDEQWTLIEDGAPPLLAYEQTGGRMVAAVAGLLSLPDPESPELSLYRDAEGAWVAEDSEGEVRRVEDQQVLAAGGRSWRVHLPGEVTGTPLAEPGPSLATARFRFAVSRNEELVSVSVAHPGGVVHLDNREHAYVLLTLARLRRADAERGVSLGERGWVDRATLLKMLALDAGSLNVAVYRARQQLLAAGVDGAQGIVEVRRGLRRFGSDHFDIGSL